MLRKEVTMERPRRWDVPFGEAMQPKDAKRLLRAVPFRDIDPSLFSPACSLHGILLNDTRVMHYQKGDIIVREGDYGSSAFLVLRGSAHIVLDSLPLAVLGRKPKRRGWFGKVARLVNRPKFPEVRRYGDPAFCEDVGRRGKDDDTRIFLQDVPGVLDEYASVKLNGGEIFGELSALSRAPRTATVIAGEETALLEIRWQGLRDIMRRAPELKQYIDQLYRENSLESHLRQTPLFKNVPDEDLLKIALETTFETYGHFEWNSGYKKLQDADPHERLQIEPLISEEGHYVNGLVLIRSGFARLSHRYGDGHRTLAYLGKGQSYGLEELAHNWHQERQVPLVHSLRAVGYVDILRISTNVVQDLVLPTLPKSALNKLTSQVAELLAVRELSTEDQLNASEKRGGPIETGLLEFLVEHRTMNGTQTMVIDLDRCTRCDDCVRACATTHDNNPRFGRWGATYENYMFAQACMHCVDPVCMIGCPTGAIGRDTESGNVVINDATCIGCSTCANSCPYENIRMVEIRDPRGHFILDIETQRPIVKATKCDLCVDQFGGPACQRACPHDALVRIDMNNLPQLSKWLDRHGNPQKPS